ncbi:YusW family protein [Ammoniphilus sp. 3BR4]|uniref:YusW family protein n=1 Tax=Ammoniphilus sp. 3BR4 TaxID=3158265 RepID=UPI003466D79D
MKINKIGYISIGAVFALIISFSLISLADYQKNQSQTETAAGTNSQQEGTQTNQSTVEGQVSFLDGETGEFKVFDGKQSHSFQLTSQTQVMVNEVKGDRNNLALNDEVKVILNSNGDARYILINKELEAKQDVQQAVNPTTDSSAGSAGSSAAAEPVPVQRAEPSQGLPFKELKVELHQGSKKVKLEWKKDDVEVEIKTGNGELKLKGTEANQYVEKWYSTLPDAEKASEEEMIAFIANSFEIDASKPFECTIEWKREGGKEGKWTVHPKDWGNGKEKSKGKSDDDDDQHDDD